MASGGRVDWSEDVGPADWVGTRLHGFAVDTGSIVPDGFEAYCRIFHPVEPDGWGGRRQRWGEVARGNGRIVHSGMQFHMIDRPVGAPPPSQYDQAARLSWGSLPDAERQVLVEVLAAATTTPQRCWFCVWEGYGDLDTRGVTARVELPNRSYLLHQGPIETVLSLPPGAWHESANLWWPDDRAWCVATEIDFAWTYVGGAGGVISHLLEDERLEALPVVLTDKPFYDSDLLNAALDDG